MKVVKNAFLVKYGEIAIKGNNRYQFENALIRQIKMKLRPIGEFKVIKEQGRVLVEPNESVVNQEEIIETLQTIFGIVGVCPTIIVEEMEFDKIKEYVQNYFIREYNHSTLTFKVETRRANKKYPLTSMEISRELGAYLLDKNPNLTVDVHHPDIKIWVEIRNKVYVYSKVVPGLGGMPLGTNGKAMLLLSGGIDSPVAGWMIAKRGVQISGVYFHSHPYTSDRAKQKVIELARKISNYTGTFQLYTVPFTDIQLKIYEECPHEQLTIIMRRIMMRIAEKIAEKNDAQALITGESLGQVASQTIYSLGVTNEVCSLPVFRPLIGYDKQDIVDIAQKIDTYETSILPYEDCCTIFVAKHPTTRPKLETILRSERKLEGIEELIQEAVEQVQIIKI